MARADTKKVDASSLNMFYNLFCMFITVSSTLVPPRLSAIFKGPTLSAALIFSDGLIMPFSVVLAKCSNKRRERDG